MATYSSNYQIKLIATGDEAGTWGTSTNKNWEKVEQSLGYSASVNIESDPSVSWDAFNRECTFTVSQADDAYLATTKGRSAYIEFTSSTVGSGTSPTIFVRGNALGNLVSRIYVVKNSLDSDLDMVLDNGSGANLTVKNGAHAFVVLYAGATTGSIATESVYNLLSDLQIDSSIIFPDAADIVVAGSTADALDIGDGTAAGRFVTVDTSVNHLKLAQGSSVNTIVSGAASIDSSAQNTNLVVKSNAGASLTVEDDTSDNFINVDSTTGSKKVVFNKLVETNAGIQLDGNLDARTAGVDVNLNTASATALDIKEGTGSSLMTFDTNTVGNKVSVTAPIEMNGAVDINAGGSLAGTFTGSPNFTTGTVTVADLDCTDGSLNAVLGAVTPKLAQFTFGTATSSIKLTGASSYLNFGGSWGATYPGFRVVSGKVEANTEGTSANWGTPYHANMKSGAGAYFEDTTLPLATGWQTYTFNHNFSSIPSLYTVYLECVNTVAYHSYSVGDCISPPLHSPINGGDHGIAVMADTSDIHIYLGNQAFYILNKAATQILIDNARRPDWKFRIKVWK